MPRIVLASQSQSRRRLLEDAGLKPTIIVSNVDEETDFFNAMTPEDMVIALAISKAHTVREIIDYPAIIIGCDSTFDVDANKFYEVKHLAIDKLFVPTNPDLILDPIEKLKQIETINKNSLYTTKIDNSLK
mgnify:CR=1 FL=1